MKPSEFSLVIVESPFAGSGPSEHERKSNELRNRHYLRACMADCLRRGESPFASHGLYTQPGVLRDGVPEEREKGISAGFAWRIVADTTVVYIDLGVSGGMRAGIEDAHKIHQDVIYRRLPHDLFAEFVERAQRDELRQGMLEMSGVLDVVESAIDAIPEGTSDPGEIKAAIQSVANPEQPEDSDSTLDGDGIVIWTPGDEF